MGLLLYKSKEMFSTTELIRKSKMIFDKIVNDEIDKAIILRDGKPGFLLMDFAKYEQIMAEYEELKNSNEEPATERKIKKQKKQKVKLTKKTKPIVEEQNNTIEKSEPFDSAKVVPPRPKLDEERILQNEINSDKEDQAATEMPQTNVQNDTSSEKMQNENTDNDNSSSNIIQTEQAEETVIDNQKSILIEDDNIDSIDEELKQALESLKSMNFDDETRAIAERKIKEKLQRVRNERIRILKEQQIQDKEDLKEELELQVQIKQENKKKEQELKEFWD